MLPLRYALHCSMCFSAVCLEVLLFFPIIFLFYVFLAKAVAVVVLIFWSSPFMNSIRRKNILWWALHLFLFGHYFKNNNRYSHEAATLHPTMHSTSSWTQTFTCQEHLSIFLPFFFKQSLAPILQFFGLFSVADPDLQIKGGEEAWSSKPWGGGRPPGPLL